MSKGFEGKIYSLQASYIFTKAKIPIYI